MYSTTSGLQTCCCAGVPSAFTSVVRMRSPSSRMRPDGGNEHRLPAGRSNGAARNGCHGESAWADAGMASARARASGASRRAAVINLLPEEMPVREGIAAAAHPCLRNGGLRAIILRGMEVDELFDAWERAGPGAIRRVRIHVRTGSTTRTR